MTKTNNQSGGWSAVRPQLASWDKPALLALMKDLYAASESDALVQNPPPKQ